MATQKKQNVITLFNNYCGEGYDFEEEKAMLEECNGREFSDEAVLEHIGDMEREDYDNAMHELKKVFGNRKVIAAGSAGTLRGNFEAAKIFDNVEMALRSTTKDCDYIKIESLNGHVKVTASHHDGTNCFDLKVLTERGEILYDNWDFNYRTKFGNLTEYQILDKIWNDKHYSKLAGKIVW